MSASTYRATIPIGPLVDVKTGRAAQDWLLWFNQISNRTGGDIGSNASANQDASATTQDQVTTLFGATGMQQAQIDVLNNEVAAQQVKIAALQAALASAQDTALIALFSR